MDLEKRITDLEKKVADLELQIQNQPEIICECIKKKAHEHSDLTYDF